MKKMGMAIEAMKNALMMAEQAMSEYSLDEKKEEMPEMEGEEMPEMKQASSDKKAMVLAMMKKKGM